MPSIGRPSDIYKLLVFFTIFSVYVSTLDTNSEGINFSGKVDHGRPINNLDKLPSKSTRPSLGDKNRNTPINKEQDDPSKGQIMTNKGNLSLAIEGEAVPQQEETHTEPELHESVNNNDNHSKGVVKGRKGAGPYPGSIVGRKGVEEQGDTHTNKSNLSWPPKESVKPNKQPTVNTEQPPSTVIPKLESKLVDRDKISQNNSPHVRPKPETLTDDGDAGEFSKYSMLKPSTTGEDYVIIGIVIVIGIWFAVFGALIFYRRAGEYWDRRHYRRMDFLVEGMYND